MFATALAVLALLLLIGLLLLIAVAVVFSHLHGLLGRCDSAYRQLALHFGRQSELLLQFAQQGVLRGGDVARTSDACRRVALLAAADNGPTDATHMQELVAADGELQRAAELVLSTAQDRVSPGDDQGDSPAAELALVSSRMSFARQTYNDVATHYNQALLRPSLRRVARLLGFCQAPCFSDPDEPAINQKE
jgi:hypothetical protein